MNDNCAVCDTAALWTCFETVQVGRFIEKIGG